MNINTITCHNVYNAGASLQAYALVEYLRGLGHNVSIIDYRPRYLAHYSLWGGNEAYKKPVLWQVYNIAKFPGRLKARFGKKKKAFDRFTERYLPLTKRSYASCDELRSDPPMADVYFAGSDQIWNPLFENGRDPAFFLEFAHAGAVRASYAASFATDNIPTDVKRLMTGWLKKLDFISVRESSGLKILCDLGIGGGTEVLDPVFLLETKEWESLATAQVGIRDLDFASNESVRQDTGVKERFNSDSTVQKPYLFLYDFDRSQTVEIFAKKLAKAYGWEIWSILPCGYADRIFAGAGPLEFLALIKNAAFVLSNSFHATAFSLIFQKQFFVFERLENINARMRDLLKVVGCGERLFTGRETHLQKLQCANDCSQGSMSENETCKIETIDYAAVSARIRKRISDSEAYIERVLNEAAVRHEKKDIICD